MVADGLGFAVDDISETIEPVVAHERVQNEFLEVAPGQVAGVHQIARGFSGGKEKIYMELQMYVGAQRSCRHRGAKSRQSASHAHHSRRHARRHRHRRGRRELHPRDPGRPRRPAHFARPADVLPPAERQTVGGLGCGLAPETRQAAVYFSARIMRLRKIHIFVTAPCTCHTSRPQQRPAAARPAAAPDPAPAAYPCASAAAENSA